MPNDVIPAIYENQIGVMLATGPSLNETDLKLVQEYREEGLVRVFGINDIYRVCDFMDVFYFCDPKWWELNPEADDNPCEQKWTQDKKLAGRHSHLKHVQGNSGKGICTEPNKIHFGSNSGFQVINLAYHFGIRDFILLGYNMNVPSGKQQHFFGPHPKGLNQTNSYKGFVNFYKSIQPNIASRIINCTEPTALGCFKKMTLQEALDVLTKRRSRKPNQEATEKSTLPGQTDTTDMGWLYGGPSSHRALTG